MENGEGNLESEFAGLAVSDPINVNGNDGLFQVVKAVEAAEATIKQQVEESNRLRSELHKKNEELEKYKLGDMNYQNPQSGRDLIDMTDVNIFNSPKQDLVKFREHEEEILQLKKHLTEYSIKEAQICDEKYVLEKRISYMRMAFDQQQQDLVDAASKAISYRQEIMEENVRLTYALQAAQQERSTFVSSLMPLLVEYSLQPPVAGAQSIVSNVKVLFRHLQEQLLVTEGKLKESQYILEPWRSDVNSSKFAKSPFHPLEIKNGLELVPQPTYLNGKMPSSDSQTDGDLLGCPQNGLDDFVKNPVYDALGRYPPLASRNLTSPAELQPIRNNEETVNKKVTFGDLVRRIEMDELDTRGHQSDREPSVNWSSKASAYPMNLDDSNSSYSPYLPPVLEEPSSSFSEVADDDPPPAIEGLQISGEAFPGRQLQACGYSINGTTSCNFEWVRHLEDGSFNYIDGAKQPNYLVTADDVDTCLAIEVQPLDDRKRKGELVKVFANEHRKITCDPEMQNFIEKTLYSGHASYKLSLSTGFPDIWEPATLAIKRDGYSIKCSGPTGVVVTENFSSSTIVSIPYGSPMEFSIFDSQGIERILRVDNSSSDISGSRDTIVLTLRLFIIKAREKKKGKKSLFFNKQRTR
ncbi:hypothetical protein Pfo_010923 [Paulownia fortunei]|nr:hypothetical protein Pfo_010923 [Paulownia fortunei]